MFKKSLYYQNSGGTHSLLTCLLVCMSKMLFQVKFFFFQWSLTFKDQKNSCWFSYQWICDSEYKMELDWNKDYFPKSGEGSTHGFWCLYNDDTVRKLTFLTVSKGNTKLA